MSGLKLKFAPVVIVNVEGNFNAVLSANRNAIGTVWNAWETTWSGTTTTRFGLEEVEKHSNW